MKLESNLPIIYNFIKELKFILGGGEDEKIMRIS